MGACARTTLIPRNASTWEVAGGCLVETQAFPATLFFDQPRSAFGARSAGLADESLLGLAAPVADVLLSVLVAPGAGDGVELLPDMVPVVLLDEPFGVVLDEFAPVSAAG